MTLWSVEVSQCTTTAPLRRLTGASGEVSGSPEGCL